MEFEWDEAKRVSTITKHGIDFVAVSTLLGAKHIRSARYVNGEERLALVGLFEGNYVVLVYTMRGPKVRLITARRARENERRAYCEAYD